MNNPAYTQALQKAVKAKFRGHENLYSKHTAKYPDSAEREYMRALAAYIKLVRQTIQPHIPELMKAVRRMQEPKTRHDDTFDFQCFLDDLFHKMRDELEKKTSATDLRAKLQSFANLNRKLIIREWRKAVKSTLGIDIMEDYYNGDFFKEQLEKWINENTNKIKSIPQESLDNMREAVMRGSREGRTSSDIAKNIQAAYGVDMRKAVFLALDQIGKLNSQITKYQQEDAGITEYIWRTTGDSRVRDTHKKLDKKKFCWSDPPLVDEKTGRHCHPGEDYRCRCIALPVFNFSTIFQESRIWKVETKFDSKAKQ